MTSNPTGLRARSIQHQSAEDIAENFNGLEPEDHRYSVIRILRDVGKELGWTSRLVTHLEMLINYTHANDWTAGGMPIVWLSQKRMAEKLGVSPSQAYRNEQRLMQLGAIAFVDSGNHRRFGSRDERGQIRVAYGLDLRPVANLLHFLKQSQKNVERERQMQRQYRTAVISLRRMIKGTLVVPENAEYIPAEFQEEIANDNIVHGPVPRKLPLDAFQAMLDHLQRLYRRLRKALLSAIDAAKAPKVAPSNDYASKMQSKECENAVHEQQKCSPPYDTYNENQQDQACSASACKHNGTRLQQPPPASSAEQPPEPAAMGADDISSSLPALPAAPPERDGRGEVSLNIHTLVRLAPSSVKFHLDRHGRPSWKDLMDGCQQALRPYGIRQSLWAELCEALGPHGAAIAFIITAQKHDRGTVGSPGGYLRGMMARAAEGELNLRASLFGLIKASPAADEHREKGALERSLEQAMRH